MKIRSLTVETHQLSEQKEFYTRVLALPLVAENEQEFSVQAGETRLTWRQADHEEAEQVYHIAFNIPENKIDEAIAWLGGRTQVTKFDPSTRRPAEEGEMLVNFSFWNAHSVFFPDAAGNTMELIARHALDNAVGDAFDELQILAVSEIGLPTRDTKGNVEELLAAFGLQSYDGEPGETFIAVGDEQGLFVIVQEGRLWASVDKPGTIHPTEVEIEVGAEYAGREVRFEKYEVRGVLREFSFRVHEENNKN